MFHDRVLKVAEALETGSIEGLGFNMLHFRPAPAPDHSGRHAPISGCIGAWAAHIALGYTKADGLNIDVPISTFAAEWLGLDKLDEARLFGMWPSGVTHVEAVKTLRRLADTGIVLWSQPVNEGPALLNF